MTTEPMTPASFAALAKEVLGWEHPRVKFDTSPRAYIAAPRNDDDYNTMWIADSDALDLLAAGAWREVRERWADQIGVGPDENGAADTKFWICVGDVEITLRGQPVDAADPANVYALLCALRDKGVKA